jgi:hypothetical protein
MALGHDRQPDPKSIERLSNVSTCRVKRSGIGNLIYCLVPNSYGCKHAERCGLLTFCFHPDAGKFVDA